ncbi:hypothetical protein VB712_18600 [Spirulina sp. CCNP1310]|uniref:hypothetical protein n=1 Tax=Spirulina sp. CCNP1310 TaxID=3110249 RepID=UPI002B221931|nr:hypothetical protein [Spirulina sp. CCNP1310]MEA5421238.1 hypothetical protein [Spirulina sp. CCNP1310]
MTTLQAPQSTTVIKIAPLWQSIPGQPHQPKLTAQWRTDANGKLYCQWLKA